MMEPDGRGIVRHAAAGTEANRVAVRAAEVVKPEARIELARIILHQSQLRPSHGTIDPGWSLDGLLSDGDR